MGQPAEQSGDDFKDVQEVRWFQGCTGSGSLKLPKFQKKFCGEAFFGMSSFKTNSLDFYVFVYTMLYNSVI